MKVGIVGAAGFVGSALCRAAQDNQTELFQITRANSSRFKSLEFDVLINASMPSKRYWALNNPTEDVMASVLQTAELFYSWNYKKFVQISSLSAILQPDIPYGAHKRAAEVIVESRENTLIVRLGALYGDGLDKSALFDLVNHNHIYVDINSEYNYADVDFVARWIMNNLNANGIKEVGAMDTISLLEISRGVWDNPLYSGRTENIFSNTIEEGMPSSKLVLDFVNKIKAR